MAMSRHSTTHLYYDGYDPTWVIGTGKPPPPHPPQAHGTNKPVAAKALAQAKGLPHAQPYQQAPGTVTQRKLQAQPHGVKGPTHVHQSQSHGQKIGGSNLRPAATVQSYVTGTAHGKPKPVPHAHGVAPVGSNLNPYSQLPSDHTRLPAVHPARGSVNHAQGPVVNAPVLAHVSAQRAGPQTGLREVPLHHVITKVVMWVPLCCDACGKRWKDKLTDLPGFQGYDVEKKLDRVTVFGHVNPSSVLATMQKVVPRTQMWRH